MAPSKKQSDKYVFIDVFKNAFLAKFPDGEIVNTSLINKIYVRPNKDSYSVYSLVFNHEDNNPLLLNYNSIITKRNKTVRYTGKPDDIKAHERFTLKCIKIIQSEIDWLKNRKRELGIEKVVKSISSMTAVGTVEKVYGHNPFKVYPTGDLEWIQPKELSLPGRAETGNILISNSKREGKQHKVSLVNAPMTTEQLEKFLAFVKDAKLINDIQE